jgi:hypothetical protein
VFSKRALAIVWANGFGSFAVTKEQEYNQIQSGLDCLQDFKHFARAGGHHLGQALLVPTAFGIGALKENNHQSSRFERSDLSERSDVAQFAPSLSRSSRLLAQIASSLKSLNTP